MVGRHAVEYNGFSRCVTDALAVEYLAFTGQSCFDFGYPGSDLSVLEADGFGAVPQGRHTDLAQLVEIAGDGRKMIAGEGTRLGGEVDTAVGDQDFGFTFTFRVEQDLPGCGISGGVFVAHGKVHIAQWNPHSS